jgi:hypothetical protein
VSPFLEAAIGEMLTAADPVGGCRECGFEWTTEHGEALAAITDAPERYAALLDGPGHKRLTPADTAWSRSAYVWHVADIVRAWSERLHALSHEPTARWAGFDPDDLARARNYDELPAITAPWALGIAVDALVAALEDLPPDTTFDHPEWGHGTLTDALRWVAHEAVHHQVDVLRARAG